MECKYCGKQISNAGSLAVHEKYYCKSNTGRQFKKSNFLEYNQKLKDGKVVKQYSHFNQYTKAKILGYDYKMSDETRRKISEKSKQQTWTNEKRLNHSLAMKKAVLLHPESYSANNVCGRTKKIEYNGKKLTGKWELEVAKFLDRKHIKWTNVITPFEYVWNQKTHQYFPDFYLPEQDLYIEVKGFKTDRDTEKWKSVKNLMIIRKKEIYELRNGFELELKPNNSY